LPAKARPKKNMSAIKKAKQADKRNLLNKSVRSKALIEASKVLQKAASKGVIHKNNAARQISRLTRKVNAMTKSEAA